MSVVAVLDIIGKSIEELQKENQRLKSELSTLYESREFMLSRLRDVEKERNELKVKLGMVQDYADGLAEKCENVSKPEETKESGC